MKIDAPAFFAAFEEAWQLMNVDEICGFFAVPQLIVVGNSSHFIETEEALRGFIAGFLGKYQEAGATTVSIADLESEALPDDAVRSTALWRIQKADGAMLLEFPLSFTLTWDTEAPDAVPIIVAFDATGEDVAWQAMNATD
jgi:hypothetical protein